MSTKRQGLESEQGGGGRGETSNASSDPAQAGGGRAAGLASRLGGREIGNLLPTRLNAEQLARGLGWFSIGLGLAEILAPRGIARVAGARRGDATLVRALGLREIAHGVAILSRRRPAPAAVWSRVVGDAIDLAVLGAVFAAPGTRPGLTAFATANVLGVTALDVLCAQKLSAGDSLPADGPAARVRRSMVINRPAAELYQFWRNFENLPQFMKHLEAVRVTGERRSHWVAKAPAGASVEWDAEITEERAGELIAWRSLEGSDVDNSGKVSFEPAPGGRGTVVRIEIEYTPPAGVLGVVAAWLSGEEPGQQAQEDLRRFKQLMETGEVVVSEGTVYDNGLLTQRPARPPEGGELAMASGA